MKLRLAVLPTSGGRCRADDDTRGRLQPCPSPAGEVRLDLAGEPSRCTDLWIHVRFGVAQTTKGAETREPVGRHLAACVSPRTTDTPEFQLRLALRRASVVSLVVRNIPELRYHLLSLLTTSRARG